MNTKFSDLTRDQKAAIYRNQEAQMRSFELEAIARGVQIPITLPDYLLTLDRVGYHIPGEAAKVYELCINKGYGDPRPTGIAYLSQEAAERALEGSVACYTEGYGNTEKWVLGDSMGTVLCRHISLTKPIGKLFSIEPLEKDIKAFEDLCDELSKEITAIMQEDYDAGVRLAKRTKYLDLANGDVAIAQNFWNGMESTPWLSDPAESVSP